MKNTSMFLAVLLATLSGCATEIAHSSSIDGGSRSQLVVWCTGEDCGSRSAGTDNMVYGLEYAATHPSPYTDKVGWHKELVQGGTEASDMVCRAPVAFEPLLVCSPTLGDYDVVFGYNNTVFGYISLSSITSGHDNTSFGYDASILAEDIGWPKETWWRRNGNDVKEALYSYGPVISLVFVILVWFFTYRGRKKNQTSSQKACLDGIGPWKLRQETASKEDLSGAAGKFALSSITEGYNNTRLGIAPGEAKKKDADK